MIDSVTISNPGYTTGSSKDNQKVPQSNLPQSNQVAPNLGVNITITDPIAPPTMILAVATTQTATTQTANKTKEPPKVESTKSVNSEKPTKEVEISKYLQTSFSEVKEEHNIILCQCVILSPSLTKGFIPFIPSMKAMLGKPKTIEEYLHQIKTGINVYKKEIDEAYEYLEYLKKHGTIPEGGQMPDWLRQKGESLSKKYVWLYASHRKLEDYGMDVDYLTMPVIDHDVVTDEDLLNCGYKNYPIILYTAKYDRLLADYAGVSTRGKLGRQLNINGTELYKLWKELDRLGLVTEYKWEKKDASGKTTTEKNIKKWLEVSRNTNVKTLVKKMDVSSNIKDKLIKYLETLKNGKKKDVIFMKKYEDLKEEYNSETLTNYLMNGLTSLLSIYGSPATQESYNNHFVPKLIEEYDNFEDLLKEGIKLLSTSKYEAGITVVNKRFTEIIEDKKKKFGGELPLGQEVLFYLLEMQDKIPDSSKEEAVRVIKLK